MWYAYGMRLEGRWAEGYLAKVDDPTDTFWGILLYDRALGAKEIADNELCYLGCGDGRIED